ncbi:MAG: hypothetical protein H6636_00010 [Anaerolineales bacterium]|nr:hypothetical protein [Anaerolineales bacterium]
MHALNCPNCGAPLTDQSGQELWLCIYCHSLIRVAADETAPQPAVEKTVSEAEMAEIKKMLAEGKREAARVTYQQIAQVTPEEAEKVVETMFKEYAFGVVRRQQLNGIGIALAGLFVVAVVLSLGAWVTGALHPAWAGIIAGFSALNLFVFSGGIFTTIKYLGAPKAKATIQHYTQTGKVHLRGGAVYTYKVLLEVHPEGKASFQDTMIVPAREKNLAKIHQGAVIWVKYKPTQPGSLLFDGLT